MGYVEGVADTLAADEYLTGWNACLVGGLTDVQLRDVVVKFLEGHPEERHFAAAALVAQALAKAFPCPKE